MSPGSESDLTHMFLTQTSAADYEALCRLDVFGLQDHPVGNEDLVFEELKEHLTRNLEGWYETGLLWKGNHPPLPNNKHGSLKRLENLFIAAPSEYVSNVVHPPLIADIRNIVLQ